MKFGIEEEFFIADEQGRCPSLERMDGFFNELASEPHWDSLQPPESGVVLQTQWGKVGVWNDFSTNILEVAYPALTQPRQFLELKQRIDQRLQQALPANGLVVQPDSVRFHPAADVVLRPAPDPKYQQRLTQALNRSDTGRPLFNRLFYADICSTQVSLSLKPTQWRSLARGLYEYEHLVPWLYCRPMMHYGTRWCCLRQQILWDNWPDDPFVGHPQDLEQLFTEVDSTTPARTVKYANIVSRDADRVEFRACDRLDSAHQIIEMTLLRILAVDVVRQFGDSGDESKFRKLYLDACGSGVLGSQIVTQQQSRLEWSWQQLRSTNVGEPWEEYARTLLARIEALGELDVAKA